MSGANGISRSKSVLNAVHDRKVFARRVEVLTGHLAGMFPTGGKVLDMGCGDGSIALGLMAQRPDLALEGVDIMVRPTTHIPVTQFDGATLAFKKNAFDYVMLVDVLHHTEDPAAVFAEAARVAKKGVVVKDHLREGFLAGPTLRFMDWVGNYGHNVVLPYNYLTRAEWDGVFAGAGTKIAAWHDDLNIYPGFAHLLFDRKLHFVARLEP